MDSSTTSRRVNILLNQGKINLWPSNQGYILKSLMFLTILFCVVLTLSNVVLNSARYIAKIGQRVVVLSLAAVAIYYAWKSQSIQQSGHVKSPRSNSILKALKQKQNYDFQIFLFHLSVPLECARIVILMQNPENIICLYLICFSR